MVLLYILLHILFAPVAERVHLNQVMNVVLAHHIFLLARITRIFLFISNTEIC